MTVFPSDLSWSAASFATSISIFFNNISLLLPSAVFRPPTIPVTPIPTSALKFSTLFGSIFLALAPWTIAVASGCSLLFSRLAHASSTSFSVNTPKFLTSVNTGFPSVRVPVLSTISTSTLVNVSRASAFLMRTPLLAPRPIPTIIDMGVAKPTAQGQAMISTDTAAMKA